MTTQNLVEIFKEIRAVLLDFDGPVCKTFAGYPSPLITGEVRREVAKLHPAARDRELHRYPFRALQQLADVPQDVYTRLELIVQQGEMHAVESSEATPGVVEFLASCKQAGLPVVIVTNNFEEAVKRYLTKANIQHYITRIFARDTTDPLLMKPAPHLIEVAVKYLGVPARSCVLIGDSTTDIEAAKAAGVRSIGYANKPWKSTALNEAGSDEIVYDMAELATALGSLSCANS